MLRKSIVLSVLLCMNFMAYAASMQGQLAPSFNLQDQSGQVHQLSDYQGQWLVVYFYPKNDTTGCTIEAKAFRDHYAELKQLNTEVLGVSLDDAESHRQFIKKYDLPFNLLVDANKDMSRAYGVDGGMAFFSYAKRQTFIIDPAGKIVKHFEEVNPSTHVDAVLAALATLQPASDQAADQKQPTDQVTEYVDGAAVYGQPWPRDTRQPVGIAAALQQPEQYSEQAVISGRVTRVCQKKGCWMILAEGDAFARVDFNDHSFLIPKDSAGEAEVYGRLVAKELSDEQIAHYQSEGSGELKKHSYEVIADAVKIRVN